MKNNILIGILMIGFLAIAPVATNIVILPSYLNAKGHPHNQDLNTSSNVNFNYITSTFKGDGGNITNITSTPVLPSYLNSIGHPHNQDLNTTNNVIFNKVTATLFGDGGNITNITSSYVLPSYLTGKAHPHNQDLNTTNDVIFNKVTSNSYVGLPYFNPFNQILNTTNNVIFNQVNATLFGDGGNITNITSSYVLPSYLTGKAHPHNQDLNTTNDVTFNDITSNNNIYIPNYYSLLFGNNAIILGLLNEGKIYEIQTGIRLIDLVVDNINGDNIGLATTNNIVYDFKLDTIGAVSIPSQPSCRARLSANQNVPTGVVTKLALATTDYDLNNDFNALNNRFICPVAGLYTISWSIYCLSLADQNTLYGAIYKNGNVAGGHELIQQSTVTTLALSLSGSDILKLAVNDYIELYVYHNYPVVTRQFPTLTYSNYLAICKIA